MLKSPCQSGPPSPVARARRSADPSASEKKAGRPSLSDWYASPEKDDSDIEDGYHSEAASDSGSVKVLAIVGPEAARTPGRKRRSLGDWWLGNEKRPSNWTPDTKVVYLDDDWEEMVREWYPNGSYVAVDVTPRESGSSRLSEQCVWNLEQCQERFRHHNDAQDCRLMHRAYACSESSISNERTEVDSDSDGLDVDERAIDAELNQLLSPRQLLHGAVAMTDVVASNSESVAPAFIGERDATGARDEAELEEAWRPSLSGALDVIMELVGDTRAAAWGVTVLALFPSSRSSGTPADHMAA